jgi:tRNA U55 pseudouridine synthase TruB
MPVRAMHIRELRLDRYEDGVAELDLLVGSGTYVRSIADVLGGHCRALRRTEIGPFSVDEADAEIVLPVADALLRLQEAVSAG